MAVALTGYEFSNACSVQRISSSRHRTTVDGSMHSLNLATTKWFSVTCVVEALDQDDRNALMDWLDDHDNEEIEVFIDGRGYRGKLEPDSAPSWQTNDALFNVSFKIRAVKI